jgi:hypothetical protein
LKGNKNFIFSTYQVPTKKEWNNVVKKVKQYKKNHQATRSKRVYFSQSLLLSNEILTRWHIKHYSIMYYLWLLLFLHIYFISKYIKLKNQTKQISIALFTQSLFVSFKFQLKFQFHRFSLNFSFSSQQFPPNSYSSYLLGFFHFPLQSYTLYVFASFSIDLPLHRLSTS